MNVRKIFLFLVIPVLFQNCTHSEKEVDVSTIQIKVSIQRIEQQLFNLKSKEEITAFLHKNKAFAEKFLKIKEYSADSILVNDLYNRITNGKLRQFYSQIETQYSNISDLEEQFQTAFKHIKYYYPDFNPPQICTMITGFMPQKDIFVSDSLIVIGLDYFVNDNSMFVPDLPQYMAKRYKRDYIVPTCMLAYSQKYNQNDERDETLLKEMIWYGKALQFTSYILPDVPDSIIIGYTNQQIIDIKDHKKDVWTHYVDKKLFYQTSQEMKPRYLGERPNTIEISLDGKCPPRTGWWLGWEIVKKYMEADPKHTLPELMKNKNAKQLFTDSGYKGQ